MAWLAAAWALVLALAASPAFAFTAGQAAAMASGSVGERVEAISEAVADPDAALAAFLQAMLEGRVRMLDGRAIIAAGDGSAVDAVDGSPVTGMEAARAIVNNNRMRREIADAIASLQLFSTEDTTRLEAARRIADNPDPTKLVLIERAAAAERVAGIRALLEQARAAILVASPEREERLAAARTLGESREPAMKALLERRLAGEQAETDAEIRKALATSLASVARRVAIGEYAGIVFSGISLGSILLLAALGLAITYGLMGVINLAHGELIMIGAYATWLTQQFFRNHLPAWFDTYLLAAVPVSFLAAAAVGAILERLVIRHLYGRALETLLATWGISLILMQAVRSTFGAQNVAVENPSWLSGGLVVLPNLVLPWNRIAIIVFAFVVVAAIALLLARSRLGLFVRAATQNRMMARCVGVPTRRVDTLAFALGAGVAGLAGCALSQVGNVGPDLGQGYIVDSFMVVVLGGVGQIAGAVYAGLGLGILNKIFEGMAGAVIAKIALLVMIILFIQKRPQGIFALKGRSAEA
jgi:urea transport system permease protein